MGFRAEPHDDAAGYQAYVTLVRATGFFATSDFARNGRVTGSYPAKVAGNSLRELDRFLNLLLDALANQLAPASFDRPGFARQHNAANKLRVLLALSAAPSPDHERLRAIGRTRNCLFHRGGISADPRTHADLAAAVDRRGPDPRDLPSSNAVSIALSPSDRSAIGAFYGRLAIDLFDHARGFGRSADAHKRVASYR